MTADKKSLPKVIEKVRALMDLAARAGTPQEAEAAAARADEILQKHRLTMADVEIAAGRATEAIGNHDDPLWSGKRGCGWRSRLAAGLGEHYGCVVYRQREFVGKRQVNMWLRLAGLPSDMEIVRFMFAWLSVEVARLAAAQRSARVRGSFAEGVVTGIFRVLDATRQPAATGGPAALVLASRFEQARTWLRTATDVAPAKARYLRGDALAYALGVNAGERVNLGAAALPGGERKLPA